MIVQRNLAVVDRRSGGRRNPIEGGGGGGVGGAIMDFCDFHIDSLY